ncbi:MAG TPA: cobalamin B12-binding domain-containing protein, partial [Steroidobacteraceae bacterium]|nr:cobalamin B12-binding domain-containing protein [Steroidobacteraceae bacterium]
IRRHAGLMLDTYERMARGPAIVFGTLSGERHELGLLLSALFAASRGFRCHYLGPDLPPDELARYAGRVQAAAVAISVVLASDQRALVREIERLAAGIGPQVRILIGGGAAGGLAASELPAQCALLADQIQFKEQLNLLSDARTRSRDREPQHAVANSLP